MDGTLRYFSRNALVLTITALSGISSAVAQSAAVNSADVVFVGHSLMNDSITHMVSELAASKGKGFSMAAQSLPGHSLWANWDKCREAAWLAGGFPPRDLACDAIDAGSVNGPYGVFIATDTSGSILASATYNDPHVYFERFMNLMLTRNPSARNFLFTSWEALDYSGHDEDWTIEVISELAIYESIATKAESLSQQRGQNGIVQVLPVNLALRRLILLIEAGSVPGLTNRQDIFGDNIHPNAIGNYFVACALYSAIFNESPEGAATLLYDPFGGISVNLSAPLAVQLQRIAWQAVSEYIGEAVRPAPPTSLTAQ